MTNLCSQCLTSVTPGPQYVAEMLRLFLLGGLRGHGTTRAFKKSAISEEAA
jgi:hypothetical protein